MPRTVSLSKELFLRYLAKAVRPFVVHKAELLRGCGVGSSRTTVTNTVRPVAGSKVMHFISSFAARQLCEIGLVLQAPC